MDLPTFFTTRPSGVEVIDLLLKLEPVLAAGGALAFVVIYLFYSRWWASPIGRHMMSFMVGMFSVLLLAIFARFFPWLLVWEVRISAWGVIILIMWWRAIIAFRVLVLKRYPNGE